MGEKDEGKKEEGGGGKTAEGPTTVVLKLDLHCGGCAKKVKRAVKHFEGVVDVKTDATSNKLTVMGSMDPAKLRDRVQEKTGKKVELLSPQPGAKRDVDGGGRDNKKADEKSADKNSNDSKKAEPKPVPMSTVVLKIRLHCDGCTQKIRKVIKKTKGVDSVDIDVTKDLVMIKGTMDPKELVAYLKDKLKRNVDVVPSKKEEGGGEKKEKEVKKDEGGGEKKEKEGGGEKKEKDTGGDKKKEGDGGGGDKKEAGTGDQSKGIGSGDGKKSDEKKTEVSKIEFSEHPHYPSYNAPMYHGYVNEGYSMPPHYNQGYNFEYGSHSNQGYTTQVYANQSRSIPSYTQTYPPNHGQVVEHSHQPPNMYYHEPPQGQYLHAPPTPSMFSDENPNACSVM